MQKLSRKKIKKNFGNAAKTPGLDVDQFYSE